MKKNTEIVWNGILCVLSLLLCLGVQFLFHACAPMEDGSWMSCHWAQEAVFGVALVLVVESVLLFLVKDEGVKNGLTAAMLPTAGLAILIPGILIRLCMMRDMRCHSTMRPAVILISVLIIAVALGRLCLRRKA